MRAITLFVMLLVTTVAAGCSNSGAAPSEPQKLGPHRIPNRPSGAARPAPPAQP